MPPWQTWSNGDKSHLIFMTYLSDEKCQIAGALVLPLFPSYSRDECSTVVQGVSVEATSYLSQRPADGQVSSDLTNCEIVKWFPFSSDKYVFRLFRIIPEAVSIRYGLAIGAT